MTLFIHWAVDSQLIDGWQTPNMYGLLFVSGIILGYFVIRKMFRAEKIEDKVLDTLVTYMVISTIVGARLGHVLFYGPYWDKIENGHVVETGYFSHPADILKIWEGGLASHGAAITILLALFIFSKSVSKKPYIWILDRIAAPIAIAGTFIRLGNLVNHELVGYVSDVPWAFEFQYYKNEFGMFDPSPRHPAQLYEAICYFISFWILMYLYFKLKKWQQPGYVFGSFLILIFGARIICEFFKLGQTARDFTLPLNTGQLLSIPLVLLGVYLIYKAKKSSATLT